MRYISGLMVLMVLCGCRSVVDPSPMPSGYSFHKDTYKAPPGPPAPEIGYPYTLGRNDVVMEKWQVVAASMVDSMEMRLGLDTQPVYLAMIPQQNAFNASLDYALREELRNRDYTLVNAPGSALQIRPEAWLPGDEKIPVQANRYNGDPQVLVIPVHREKAHEFSYKLTALRHDILVGEVTGEFTLPAYGYMRGEGQDRITDKTYIRPSPSSGQAAQDGVKPASPGTETEAAPQSILPLPAAEEIIQEKL